MLSEHSLQRSEGEMKREISQKLSELPHLDRKRLHALWFDLFGRNVSPKVRREILIPMLAYRMQEKARGGLTTAIVKQLKALADHPSAERPATARPTVGTRFVREWQGSLHEVTMLADGYEYRGNTYGSLSEIARKITGTRWSGPAFFGLKKCEKKEVA